MGLKKKRHKKQKSKSSRENMGGIEGEGICQIWSKHMCACGSLTIINGKIKVIINIRCSIKIVITSKLMIH